MTEEVTAPAQEAPQGLDAVINSAIDTHYVEPGEPPKETTEAAPAEAAPTDSRNRDERGRFAPKAEAAGTPQGTAKAEAAPAEAPTDPATKPVDPPAHFNAEQRTLFAKLPREAQEIVVSNEKAREADYTRKSQEHADFRRNVEPFLEAVKPYQQYLSQLAPQIGQTPAQMVNAILAAEYRLRNAPPPEKYQAFAELARTYGIDLAAFTGAPQQQFANPQPAPQPYIDPRLQQQLASVSQEIAQIKQERELSQAHKTIEAFAAEKDEAGSPKYPLFERVRGVMHSIIQSGQAEDLPTAYKLATDPIKDLIASQVDAAKAAAENERKASLEKAKAAAPVAKSTGTMPKGATQAKGLDAILTAAIDQHYTG